MQLVSAQDPGSNYYAWVVASWLQFHLFPEVVFDSQAIGVQFVEVGDWMHGNPSFKFRFHNSRSKEVALNVAVSILDPDGKSLFDKTSAVMVKLGESKEAVIAAAGLPLGDLTASKKDNWVLLKITDAATGAIYYDHQMPLRKHNAEVDGYINNLQVARKLSSPALQFAYMPSYNRLKVTGDNGILGLDPDLKKKAKCLHASFGKQSGETMGRNSAPFAPGGVSELTFSFPPLPEGKYDITLEIQDASGKALLTKKDTFERKLFPFESFKGGTADTVVRPYTPLRVGKRNYETAGNRVELTRVGMVSQFHDLLVPEEAGRDLLAGPVQLIGRQNGRAVVLTEGGDGFSWENATLPTRASGRSGGAIGSVAVELHSEADYTGQYLTLLELNPRGNVNLDRLELVIPLKDPVDTAFAYSPRDSIMLYRKNHPYTGTPKEGVLWTNLSERPTRPHVMYVGNGERGLYWYTDSYEGFYLDKHQPHIVMEKVKGATVLKIAFINRSVVLDRPRQLKFAFLPVPTKPLPPDARTMAWNSERMHIGGASWWGTAGCFVFPLDDREWQDWIAGKPFKFQDKTTPGSFPVMPPPKRDAQGRYLLEKGREYGSYRAADLIGHLQPEFSVFSGEWAGETNPRPQPDSSLLHYRDKDGNPIWPEPEQRTVYLKDACVPSFYDFEAYYFYLMAKNTGAGGHWWDWNSLVEGRSLDKGSMYLNDEGKPEPRLNLFLVRDYYQRVARIVQELGIPDTNNVYSPGAVFQMPWLTRMNAWESMYLESDLDDMFSAQGLDKYRTIIGKYSGIPVQIVMNIPIDLKSARARTVFALALLHDNGIFGADWSKDRMEILRNAGVLDSYAEWIPYWRSQSVAAADQPGVLISVYRNTQAGRTTLVVVNPGDAGVETNIKLGSAIQSAKDGETGEPILVERGRIRKLTVKRHDFRLVVVE